MTTISDTVRDQNVTLYEAIDIIYPRDEQLDQLKGQLDDLAILVRSLDTKLNGINVDINTRVDKLEEKVVDLGIDYKQLENRLIKLIGEVDDVDEEVKKQEVRLKKVENELDNYSDIESRLTVVEKEIKAIDLKDINDIVKVFKGYAPAKKNVLLANNIPKKYRFRMVPSSDYRSPDAIVHWVDNEKRMYFKHVGGYSARINNASGFFTTEPAGWNVSNWNEPSVNRKYIVMFPDIIPPPAEIPTNRLDRFEYTSMVGNYKETQHLGISTVMPDLHDTFFSEEFVLRKV